MKNTVLFFAIGVINCFARADDINAQSLLAMAKVAGSCGAMNQLVNFQTSTKMPGGDEFVVRFWATESARLGMTIDKFTEYCAGAINHYQQFFEAAEKEK